MTPRAKRVWIFLPPYLLVSLAWPFLFFNYGLSQWESLLGVWAASLIMTPFIALWVVFLPIMVAWSVVELKFPKSNMVTMFQAIGKWIDRDDSVTTGTE